MRIHLNTRERCRLSARLLLVALLFRAYVPAGFMPSGGSPWLLALCAEGLWTPMPVHHDHHPSSPGHNHFEHCPSGSTPAGGPLSALAAAAPTVPASAVPFGPDARSPLPVRLSPAHPPRGPPKFA